MLTCVVLSLFLFSGIDCAEEWSYAGETGPDHWAEIDGAFCDGESQSPIDIDTGNVVLQDYEDWTMEGYNFDEEVGYATLVSNNGHTLAVNLAGDFSLSGGGLPNKFKAAQFHFHWGSVNTQGSEHTVDRTSFPAEVKKERWIYPSLYVKLSTRTWARYGPLISVVLTERKINQRISWKLLFWEVTRIKIHYTNDLHKCIADYSLDKNFYKL